MAAGSKKEALIQECCEWMKESSTDEMRSLSITGEGSVETVGFIDVLLPILLPIFLEWFTKCLKGPASKKAAQIDEEYRRLSQVGSGSRRERRLHKKAEKLFKSREVIEANGGNELSEAQEDALYERMVRYAFENRNAVAKVAATRG